MTLHRAVEHIRGAAVLGVALLMLILGTPGLDLLGPQLWLPGSVGRQEQISVHPLGWIPVWFADANRAVRQPIVDWVTPLQRPLRLAQAWGLYGRGPRDVRRLEIAVDGQVVYRSNDPEARWLRSVLRYRKIRPIVDAHCGGHSKNSLGLSRYIARKALEEWPDAQEIEIRCVVRPWKAPEPTKVLHRRTLTPPWGDL